MSISEFTLRLLLALVLGAFIGFERQWRQKSAGLKTNTLVSLGSAAFILLSVSITGYNVDPTRIAGQIVTGIGFIGAGVIMRHGLTVQGLNTAATIWCSAAVGSLAGIGLYIQAIITAAIIILAHLILRPIELKIIRYPLAKSDDVQHHYHLILKSRNEVENHLRVLLMQNLDSEESLMMRSLKSADDVDGGLIKVIIADILASGKQDHIIEKVVSRLTIEKGVLEVSWAMSGIENDE
jgi:putative Mg2+ transporter-C (MgtC) family protein